MGKRLLLIIMCLFPVLSLAEGECRALLVACRSFLTEPDLGYEASGNLQMMAATLSASGAFSSRLAIEDGTLSSRDALAGAVSLAFEGADEEDLSVFYLCTHGILSDSGTCLLLLSDGQEQHSLSAQDLYTLFSPIPGEKLLILDACHSGALIGHGRRDGISFPSDAHLHILTSAHGDEPAWYYGGSGVTQGALSYFVNAFCAGLGLFGTAEADVNGDERVTLQELYDYLSVSVPSSCAQLSTRSPGLPIPIAHSALSRPLTGFTWGNLLLSTLDPLSFSFTTDGTASVQYRLVAWKNGQWDWNHAHTFLDDVSSGIPSAGRCQRTLSLPENPSTHYLFQVFSVTEALTQLCAERMLAVTQPDVHCTLEVPERRTQTGEVPILVRTNVPVSITVRIRDTEGTILRHLALHVLSRPTYSGITSFYWNTLCDDGSPAPAGIYEAEVYAANGSVPTTLLQSFEFSPIRSVSDE